LTILCAVGALFGFGVFRRQAHSASADPFHDSEKRVVPALTAAKEITKAIPDGVPELAHAADRATPEPSHPPATTPPHPRPPTPPATPVPLSSTREDRSIALAYEREMQAQVAPTSIQRSGAAASAGIGILGAARPPAANDTSPIAGLAQAIAANTSPKAPSVVESEPDQNLQARKEAFLASARAAKSDDYLHSTRTPPISAYEIKAGWEIPAMLEQEINSDLPGELKALVISNVFDTATGFYLLIPQGSRLVGSYDSAVAYAQSGLQVVWKRLIYPDASSIDLGGMVGQDSHGNAGFRDKVDNHYRRIIGSVLLSSIFSAAFQLSQSQRGNVLQTASAGETVASAVGREVSQAGAQITRRNLNIQPTIRIPIGYRFNVRVNRDMLFDEPYAVRP
jgi:type IV secretion system protein VirB10